MGDFDNVKAGGSSTASPWQPVAESAELVLGRSYRARFTLAGPYASDTPQKIKAAVQAGAGLNNALAERHLVLTQMVSVQAVRVSAPDTAQRFFAFPVFSVEIDFKKTGPGTPVLVVAGILIALVLFGVGLAFIVTKKEIFERVQAGGEQVQELIGGALVPLALSVALVVYFLRRS